MTQPDMGDVHEHFRRRLVSSPGSSVLAADLYDDFSDWCEAQGKQPLLPSAYFAKFKALGVRKEAVRRRVHYLDIELRNQYGTGRQ